MSVRRKVKDFINTNNLLRKLIQPLRVIKRKIKEAKWHEKKRSFGEENSEKTFYVIRRADMNCGLFSYFITVMGHLKIAETRGLIPVVDMQNYENCYLEVDELGKVNSWEYFFKQVSEYSLDTVYHSKNVILSDGGIPIDIPQGTIESLYNVDGVMDEWRNLAQRYLRYNDTVLKSMEQEYESLVLKNDRVLGVICRGTDYVKYKPVGHWRQPDVDTVIEKAKEVCAEKKCNKVFLATEDVLIYEQFKKVFGANLIVNQKHWIDYDGKQGINNYSISIEKGKMIQGLEYLTTIYILSKCNCLIGGRAGGTVGAMVLSKGYEYEYFWDLGVYTMFD